MGDVQQGVIVLGGAITEARRITADWSPELQASVGWSLALRRAVVQDEEQILGAVNVERPEAPHVLEVLHQLRRVDTYLRALAVVAGAHRELEADCTWAAAVETMVQAWADLSEPMSAAAVVEGARLGLLPRSTGANKNGAAQRLVRARAAHGGSQ